LTKRYSKNGLVVKGNVTAGYCGRGQVAKIGESEFREAVHLVGVSCAPVIPVKLEMVEIWVKEPIGPDLFFENQEGEASV
jgi:hypothetical protein